MSKVVIIKHTLSLHFEITRPRLFFKIDNTHSGNLKKSKACSRRRRRCRRARARLLEQRSFSRRRRLVYISIFLTFNSFAFSIGVFGLHFILSIAKRGNSLLAALFNEERSFEGESIVSFSLSLTFA